MKPRRPINGRLEPINTFADFSSLGNHITPCVLGDFIKASSLEAAALRERGQIDQVLENIHLMGMILTMDGIYKPKEGEFNVEFEVRGAEKRQLRDCLLYQHPRSSGIIVPNLDDCLKKTDQAANAIRVTAGEGAVARVKLTQITRLMEYFPDLNARPYLQKILGL